MQDGMFFLQTISFEKVLYRDGQRKTLNCRRIWRWSLFAAMASFCENGGSKPNWFGWNTLGLPKLEWFQELNESSANVEGIEINIVIWDSCLANNPDFSKLRNQKILWQTRPCCEGIASTPTWRLLFWFWKTIKKHCWRSSLTQLNSGRIFINIQDQDFSVELRNSLAWICLWSYVFHFCYANGLEM